jgi:hypothetical protein
MTTEPSTPPEEPAVPRVRSAQDKTMESRLIAAEQLGKVLLDETEVSEELEEGSYDQVELLRFTMMQKKGWDDFVIQGQTAVEQKIATKKFNAANRAARGTFTKFRGMGKSAFMKDPEGRQAVGLNGVEPDSLTLLIGAGRKLTTAGGKPEYAEKLAKVKLADLSAKLDALEAADQAQEAAKAAAGKALAQRNASAQLVFDWVAEFRTFAKAQFKDRPDVLKRWGIK